jgi:hypothetical protein
MDLAFYTIQPRNNKTFMLNIIPRIVEGRNARYITGSGQTKSTADRVSIFRREGNCEKIKRPPRRRKEAVLEAAAVNTSRAVDKKPIKLSRHVGVSSGDELHRLGHAGAAAPFVQNAMGCPMAYLPNDPQCKHTILFVSCLCLMCFLGLLAGMHYQSMLWANNAQAAAAGATTAEGMILAAQPQAIMHRLAAASKGVPGALSGPLMEGHMIDPRQYPGYMPPRYWQGGVPMGYLRGPPMVFPGSEGTVPSPYVYMSTVHSGRAPAEKMSAMLPVNGDRDGQGRISSLGKRKLAVADEASAGDGKSTGNSGLHLLFAAVSSIESTSSST